MFHLIDYFCGNKHYLTMKVNIEERVERARGLFLEGYNCAQSVFLAYRDLTPFDEIGRASCRERVCLSV